MSAFHVSQSPPVPAEDPRTAFYWQAVAEGRIELLRCQGCGHFVHYPRPVCNRCRSADLVPTAISGRGTLYSYCEVNQVAHPFYADKVPYLIGVVDIEEEAGVRIPAGLVDCAHDDLRCGIPMEAVFRQVTPTLTLPYFRPQGVPDAS